MTVTAVVISHNNPEGMERTLKMLAAQTRPPDEVLLYVSDTSFPDATANTALEYCREIIIQPNHSDAGHAKRARGLELARGDYVGFFNDDDEVTPDYIEKMIARGDDADIIACDFVSHNIGPVRVEAWPEVGRITAGCYLVRRELAQRVGYKHRVYEADGLFIVDLMRAGASFKRVPEVLHVNK